MTQIYERILNGWQRSFFGSAESQVEERVDEKAVGKQSDQVFLNPAAAARVLGWLTVFLVIVSTIVTTAHNLTGYTSVNLNRLVKIFSVDLELNAPTFFSMLMMIFASMLLALIAYLKRKQSAPYVWHWAVLSFGFMFMAFDEIVAAHERTVEPLRAILARENLGVFYFAWVIPATALVSFLALIFFKFWLRLPSKTRISFFIAAALFLGGSIGLELIGGRHYELYGKDNLTYILITTIEETLELAAMVVFVWALLGYIADNFRETRIRFGTAKDSVENK